MRLIRNKLCRRRYKIQTRIKKWFLNRKKKKKGCQASSLAILLLFLSMQSALADPVSLKGAAKIHRKGGYIILINYETRDRSTDNLSFKVHCKFDKGELTVMSSSLDNIQRGWHKVELPISNVTRKQYGPLREYKIDLYRDGILVATKTK